MIYINYRIDPDDLFSNLGLGPDPVKKSTGSKYAKTDKLPVEMLCSKSSRAI